MQVFAPNIIVSHLFVLYVLYISADMKIMQQILDFFLLKQYL